MLLLCLKSYGEAVRLMFLSPAALFQTVLNATIVILWMQADLQPAALPSFLLRPLASSPGVMILCQRAWFACFPFLERIHMCTCSMGSHATNAFQHVLFADAFSLQVRVLPLVPLEHECFGQNGIVSLYVAVCQ